MKQSFSTRLSLRLLLIVSLLFVVVLLAVGSTAFRIISSESRQSMLNLRDGVVAEVEQTLGSVELSADNLALAADAVTGTDSVLALLSRHAVCRIPMHSSFYLALEGDGAQPIRLYRAFRPAGGGVVWTDVLDQDSAAASTAEQWYARPAETGRAGWLNPYINPDGERVTAYSIPLFGKGGRLAGVVAAEISLDWLDERMDSIRTYEHTTALIICPDSSVIGPIDTNLFSDENALATDYRTLERVIAKMLRGETGVDLCPVGAKLFISAYAPLHNGWALTVNSSQSDVLKPARTMLWALFVIGVVGLLAMFVVCFFFVRRMTRPVTKLAASALEMAKGNFNATLPQITTKDEMRQLCDAFSYLQTSLVSYIAELKHTTAVNMRMEGELTAARAIQKGMLSTDFPPELYAVLSPAKEVGGDFYDFCPKGDKLYLAVGDVSGKGVPAALLMAITRSTLHFLADDGLSMAQIMERANLCISESNHQSMFVTLFIARIDLASGLMEYCNAGHNPLLVLPPVGDPYLLDCKPNLVAGIDDSFRYQDECLLLSPGTRILLYTDGVTEAERADCEQFGAQRLLSWAADPILRNPACSSRAAVESLFSALQEFVCRAPQNDDVTILSFLYRHDPIIHSSMTRRFNPITGKCGEIVDYIMSSPLIPVEKDLQFKIRLAVEEAVENVVRYAYDDGRGWLEVNIRLAADGLRLVIVLRDAGRPFNPLDAPDPDTSLSAADRGVGGLGIFLCKKLMDQITYSFEDGVNVLTMEKRIVI